jgi:flavin-dependent dehydrogenase
VRFGQRVISIEEYPAQEHVKVMAHEALGFNRAGNHHGDVIYEARYVIGTDGANSTVGRILCIVRLSNLLLTPNTSEH